ncbi:rho GTPase-activating protein 11A-like [Rhynchocyon petersi]
MWDHRLVRVALRQQLHEVYGIKVKGGRGQCDRRRKETAPAEIRGKIFGVPFNALPHSFVPEYGHIPSFLVDACTFLEEHVHTEGLFRKSGSVIRLRALKNKLDHGERCLTSAAPCDIAGLLKQFFRELPEPILPADLHEALFKAQQLGEEEKNTATVMLSCLMADHTIDILRYFFNFLRNVSLRSSENKMDSSNLAVIFAPNLLQTNEGREKMPANTEKKLRLQAAVVQTFIDYASDIGRVPDLILEKIPAMLGTDDLSAPPSLDGFEEGEYESPGECKRRRRQSVGDFVSGALNKLKSNRTPTFPPQQEKIAQVSVSPVILTPSAKRKLPVDSSHGFSSKKRKSIKHSLNFELLPSSLFSSSSPPVSVHFDTSPEGSSQSSLTPGAVSGNQMNTGVQRRSKRIAGKKVCRAESGKAGCFSPKISRKEKVRRSLRLKFSLGKSSRDVNGCSGVDRYENVGRRLANQQSFTNGIDSVKTGLLFSPDISERLTRKGSKKISKSEENLLTPERVDGTNYRMSWTGPSSSFQEIEARDVSPITGILEIENFSLESDLMVEKSSVTSNELISSSVDRKHDGNVTANTLSGDESTFTTDTLLKIQKAFSESGSNLHELINHKQSPITDVGKVKLSETSFTEYSPEKNLFETNDLTVMESKEKPEHHTKKDENSLSESSFSPYQTQKLGKEITMKGSSTQMKMEHENSIHSDTPRDYSGKQEGPNDEQINKQESARDEQNTKLKEPENVIEEDLIKHTASMADMVQSPLEHITCHIKNTSKPKPVRIVKQQSLVGTHEKTVSENVQMTEHAKVSDHIQWFNQLSLNEPKKTKAKSPLKFQRTPICEFIRRINSLIEYNRQPVRRKLVRHEDAASPLIKAVSSDSALSCIQDASQDSSTKCNKSGLKEQKPILQEQPSVDIISKSSMEVTSKSLSKVTMHQDSVNSLGSAGLCKQKVIPHDQIKVPLDDLTNYSILKSVVNNNVTCCPGINNKVLRKPSERERAWYKGSPKNPIGKVQLLPSRPIDL